MTKKKEHKEAAEKASAEEKEQDKTHSVHSEECPCNDPHAEGAHETGDSSKEEEYYQQLLRLKADFENYRKRTEREKPLFIKYGKEEVIKKFIPLYDTLLKAKAQIAKDDSNIENIKQGLNMIFEEFGKVFKSEGVEVLSCKGKPYDPMIHEAVTTMPCEDKDDNTVLEELSSGVSIDGNVIRPAQVIVGKKKED